MSRTCGSGARTEGGLTLGCEQIVAGSLSGREQMLGAEEAVKVKIVGGGSSSGRQERSRDMLGVNLKGKGGQQSTKVQGSSAGVRVIGWASSVSFSCSCSCGRKRWDPCIRSSVSCRGSLRSCLDQPYCRIGAPRAHKRSRCKKRR